MMTYKICTKGHLKSSWCVSFDGWTSRDIEGGLNESIGPIRDQAELFGILRKIRDLGLELHTVQRLDSQEKMRSKSR